MKHSKQSFWLLIGVGILALSLSVYFYLTGKSFSVWLLQAFCEIILIFQLFDKPNKSQEKEGLGK